jgi:hypothetical protein
MRRVFKTRHFVRWMRKTSLVDAALCSAVAEMVAGLIDADLGRSVFKKRVALPGRGKSGSARTLVATNRGSRWFFVFGFEKNERANIDAKELEAVQHLADDLLGLGAPQIEAHAAAGALMEICRDEDQHTRQESAR